MMRQWIFNYKSTITSKKILHKWQNLFSSCFLFFSRFSFFPIFSYIFVIVTLDRNVRHSHLVVVLHNLVTFIYTGCFLFLSRFKWLWNSEFRSVFKPFSGIKVHKKLCIREKYKIKDFNEAVRHILFGAIDFDINCWLSSNI